jgi:hypothetical protein
MKVLENVGFRTETPPRIASTELQPPSICAKLSGTPSLLCDPAMNAWYAAAKRSVFEFSLRSSRACLGKIINAMLNS